LKLSRQEEVDYLSKRVHILGKNTIFYQQRTLEQVLEERNINNQPLPNDAYSTVTKRRRRVTLTFEKEGGD
jgi:hypothetical protein